MFSRLTSGDGIQAGTERQELPTGQPSDLPPVLHARAHLTVLSERRWQPASAPQQSQLLAPARPPAASRGVLPASPGASTAAASSWRRHLACAAGRGLNSGAFSPTPASGPQRGPGSPPVRPPPERTLPRRPAQALTDWGLLPARQGRGDQHRSSCGRPLAPERLSVVSFTSVLRRRRRRLRKGT